MNELIEFIERHAEQGSDQPDAVDMVFFKVSAKNDPEETKLRQLIEDNIKGEFTDLDPWDGKEHSYMEVGGWIGDQGLALTLMGLGSILGLWKLMTPKMLPGLPNALVMEMAGRGMITIHSPN